MGKPGFPAVSIKRPDSVLGITILYIYIYSSASTRESMQRQSSGLESSSNSERALWVFGLPAITARAKAALCFEVSVWSVHHQHRCTFFAIVRHILSLSLCGTCLFAVSTVVKQRRPSANESINKHIGVVSSPSNWHARFTITPQQLSTAGFLRCARLSWYPPLSPYGLCIGAAASL